MKLTHTQPAKYALVATVLAAGLLAGAQSAQAGAVQTEPTVTTQDYSGTAGTVLPSGFSITTSTGFDNGFPNADNTLKFTSATGGGFTRLDAQAGSSAFTPGTKLIETFDGSNASGPLTISFSKAVDSFSFFAQDYYLDKEKFTYTVFEGATQVGTFSTPTYDNTSAQGKLAFIGASDSSGITSVVISSTSFISGSATPTIGTNDFLVGPISFSNLSPVPEASTLVSFGAMLGLGGIMLAARRRVRRPNAAS